MRIAVIGSGIAGLAVADRVHRAHELTVFEADDRIGGHANTIEVDVDGLTTPVDTGFIVYNERNYPGLTELFDRHGVVTEATEMSFSVQDERTGLAYRGTSARTVFAQPANAGRPRFWRLLIDIVRFNRAARALLLSDPATSPTLDEFLAGRRFSPQLKDLYVTPLGSAIWSADPVSFGRFPMLSLARFLDNHGLLGFGDRPQWRTVSGGSRRYVQTVSAPFRESIRLSTPVDSVRRVAGGVELVAGGRDPERFDRVVLACHSDQALDLLADATAAEEAVLGAIRYLQNTVTLHTDGSVLPREARAVAAWNAFVPVGATDRPTLTYDMNILQNLGRASPVCVSVNSDDRIDEDRVLSSHRYAHPVFDAAAVAAQDRWSEIDGRGGVHFCGAYWGYGFHEDGLQSGARVADAIESL